jgi:DMSO/TMAO reductase YedYZ molybdopterin-dependent catalytic subunit
MGRRKFLASLAALFGEVMVQKLPWDKLAFGMSSPRDRRLPPGQRWVEELIEYSAGGRPPIDEKEWRFDVDGLVERPLSFSWDEFQALPHSDLVVDFHCVTAWSVKDSPWRGVLLNDLLEKAGVRAEARFVFAGCYGGYTTNFPLETARRPDVFLADGYRGKPLPRMFGGPMRLVVPPLYAYKSAKWVNRITLLKKDRPGFWEENGYSNLADPWKEQRHTGDDRK